MAIGRINTFLLKKRTVVGFLYQTAAWFTLNYCFSNERLLKMYVNIHQLFLNLAR